MELTQAQAQRILFDTMTKAANTLNEEPISEENFIEIISDKEHPSHVFAMAQLEAMETYKNEVIKELSKESFQPIATGILELQNTVESLKEELNNEKEKVKVLKDSFDNEEKRFEKEIAKLSADIEDLVITVKMAKEFVTYPDRTYYDNYLKRFENKQNHESTE